jgi:hypothetical protein
MRYLVLIVTLIVQIVFILNVKLLDSFSWIIGMLAAGLLLGAIFRFSSIRFNNHVKNVGWGIFYGSLVCLSVVTVFMVWLSFNLPSDST